MSESVLRNSSLPVLALMSCVRNTERLNAGLHVQIPIELFGVNRAEWPVPSPTVVPVLRRDLGTIDRSPESPIVPRSGLRLEDASQESAGHGE